MYSDEIIEARANLVRQKLGIAKLYAFDVYDALNRLVDLAKNFHFRAGTDAELGSDEAIMDYDSDTLIVRDHVLNAMRQGLPRARFTAAHELGHFFLGHTGRRARNKERSAYVTSEKMRAETEANKFASYLLVPTSLAMDAAGPDEISARFQVSFDAAQIAYERVASAKRRAAGTTRRPPDSVIDFLKEARRRGYKVQSDLSEYE